MPEVLQSYVNRALEQLEGEGVIALLSLETDDRYVVAGAISDPVRGQLTHIELRQDL
ncbi:hypothetical protein [Polyangium jinanense]|uniref:Uncharacterized protein n=1 Tax=Polyangium jinanense TaxID=2829994 RepID=A0A9X3X8L8_9BACT|nr:hypothetical protein [Polyangium jinanense]MDC3984555.1 hypothetical protein [Polyangium jinanense]